MTNARPTADPADAPSPADPADAPSPADPFAAVRVAAEAPANRNELS